MLSLLSNGIGFHNWLLVMSISINAIMASSADFTKSRATVSVIAGLAFQ